MKIELIPHEPQFTKAIEKMIAADTVSGMLFSRLYRDMQNGCSMIYADGALSGVLLRARSGDVYYRMVFIDLRMRRKGIGTAVMHMAEEELEGSTEVLTAFYNFADGGAVAFAAHLGFQRFYDCTYMEYAGGKQPTLELPVRQYRDADYLEAEDVRAQAFHRMRVQVGDFPNSVPTQPSEKGRKAWKADAENFFLYELDGEIVGVGHLFEDEISSVSVRIDHQGQGIGSRFVPYLMNVILDRGYACVHLDCVVGNPARRLYDRLGFQALYTQRFVQKKIG